MFVLDTHCDTPSMILESRNLALDNKNAHVDFPKLRRGGIDGAFFALYVPSSLDYNYDMAFRHAEELLEGVKNTIESNPDLVSMARSESDALRNKQNGKFSVFLGLENGSPIGESIDRLHWFYDVGVRYVTLCHAGNNQICDSCATDRKTWNGLSPFGKEFIKEMNSMGMLIDVSHISDASFYDVLKYSSRPVVATHSCCRALADHPRNMTDEMIRAIAAEGGVVQINFYPVFLDNDYLRTGTRPSYKRIVDHIDHVVSLVGIDYVGIGSDFDGIEVTPEGMDDISALPLVFEEMRKRGYSDDDISKTAGRNFFRIL